MMLAAKFDMMRMLPTETESAFEYWMSMSPAAPMFGVRWRFADMVFGAPDVVSPSKTANRTPAAPVQDAEPVAEPAPAPVAEPAPEPVAEAAPEPVAEAAPGPAAEPAPEPETPAAADDLTAIKGIGPKMATKLAAEGVTSFRQIAAWSTEEAEALEARIGGLPGCILRDDWIGQAKSLSA